MPDSGRVLFRDQDIYDCDENLLKNIRKEIALVFQEGAHLSNLIIRENILLPLKYHDPGLDLKAVETRLQQIIQEFEIGDVLDKRPAQISNIKRKLLAFVRAIVMNPALVLIDEPLFNLDYQSQLRIIHLLKKWKKEKVSQLIVSNSLDVLKAVADSYLHIEQGTIRELVRRSEPDFFDRALALGLSDLTGVEDEI